MIPFAARASYYLFSLSSDACSSEEREEIEGRKEAARSAIAGGLVLSVPLEGGASVLKRRSSRPIMISQHGRWQDVHLGALRAAYGRTPFFPYLFPRIEEIYREKSEGPLADFNSALHDLAVEWLGLREGIKEELRKMKKENPDRFSEITGAIGAKINMEYSIFDTLFRLGKESVFGLCSEEK